MTIDIIAACKMLGYEYESALENMWESYDLDEEVDIATFLKAWTEYIAETTAFAVKNGLN